MKMNYKGYEITSIDELINFAKTSILDHYKGFNEIEKSMMYSSVNHDIVICIDFENIYECRLFESKIRKYCIGFSPKKYIRSTPTSIGVTESLKQELKKLKEENESYEMVIWKLLLDYLNIQ